jgi:hypothetical protein
MEIWRAAYGRVIVVRGEAGIVFLVVSAEALPARKSEGVEASNPKKGGFLAAIMTMRAPSPSAQAVIPTPPFQS